MSLTKHLYKASRARRSVLSSDRRPLDPALLAAMERVVDRELPAYRAARLAAIGERELIERLTHGPAPAPRALPSATLPSARPPLTRRSPEPCSVCGGAVVVGHIDLTTAVARLECSDCGRHWNERPDSRAQGSVG